MITGKLTKYWVVASLHVLSITAFSQVSDNFTDGDFLNNPTWAGDNAKFIISSGMLKLQAPAVAETAYLSTTSSAIHNASWELLVQMDFNPSSTNYSRIYLTSDQSNLSQPLNGYYVMIGNTADEISLYKQTGTTLTKIIDGVDGRVNLSTFSTRIKVTRDAAGMWELFSDVGLTGTYVSEGIIVDLTHTVSNYFGVHCTYTSTRSSHFWFDNVIVTGSVVPDLTPPTVGTVQIESANSIIINFSEELDQTTAQDVNNYTIDHNIANPSTAILQPDKKSVRLSLPTPLTNGINYSIQIAGVNDISSNAMSLTTKNFLYFVPQPVSKDDIVVSEFMADQTPVVGLPEAEFVELFNRSTNPINLSGWKLTDGSSIANLPNYILIPNAYCVITASVYANLFPGSIGVSNFPSLNNSGDDIILRNNNGVTIDSIHYAISWYHSDEKKDGGWSIEIIDPDNLCGEEDNWTASENQQGGSPGFINSVDGSNPDVKAPTIIYTSAAQNSVRVSFSEKMQNTSVNVVSVPSINFTSQYSGSLKQLILTPLDPILSSATYTVTLLNAKDCAGNDLLNNTFQFVFPEAAQTNDIVVNEILFNPKTGGVDFVELYNNSSKYISLKKWTIANYDGVTITNAKSLGTQSLIIPPNDYRVITSDSSILVKQYPNTLKAKCLVSTLPSFPDDKGSVALVDSLGNVIDYFIYNENYHLTSLTSKEGVSLERISVAGLSNDSGNWRSADASENFATPGYKNSASYPFLLSSTFAGDKAIKISFNSTLDLISALTNTSYSLNQSMGHPINVELQNENKDVLITFDKIFTNGLNYNLIISGIKDPDGKILSTLSLNLLYFFPTQVNPKDIIISEFMADPTPVVGLPEAEFVELFNRSDNPINLLGWVLTDGSLKATLPNYILLPRANLVVTTTANATKFSGSIGVANFPSLNNTSDDIVLKTNANLRIDSIHYSLSWYHSDEKKDGGWSLEIIDTENLCGEENNWTASTNIFGGTPGATNSVNGYNPDIAAPKILTTDVKPNSIIISFNERMDTVEVEVMSDGSISFSSIQYSPTFRQLTLFSSTPFQPSAPYTIRLENAKDCSGNALAQNQIQFVVPEAAQVGDVLINEILFNPKPGGVDFVELYNKSGKYISLKKWSIANFDGVTLTNPKSLGTSSIILSPYEYKTLTTDSALVTAQYPNAKKEKYLLTTLPPLPDDKGSVGIVDSLGNVIDYFVYKETYHLNSLTSKEGVSLERLSPLIGSADISNWRSASADENYATPGYKNSASYPYLTVSFFINTNSIKISFSSALAQNAALQTSNYFLNNGFGNPIKVELQNEGKDVVLTFSADFKNGVSYSLSITGLKDPDGKLLSPINQNFLYFFASSVNPKDVIISEFMADPTPVVGLPEVEYIEIYNRSINPINLAGWKISDGSTTATLAQYILQPASYVVISTNATSSLFSPSIGVSSFPSLNNTTDNIILKDQAGKTIDSLTYNSSWYHSDEKKDGGWSLEIIDPDNLCEEDGNWSASENVKGGTPGTLNSIDAENLDLTSPTIQSLIATSSSVEILLDEKMNGSIQPSVSLNPTILTSDLSYDKSLKKLLIHTSTELQQNIVYNIIIQDAYDCSGNKLEKNSRSFVLPEEARPGDVLINEILFNPKSGGVDFVEIYNKSDKYLSLSKWSLANQPQNEIENKKEIKLISPVINPNAFMVFTSDPTILKSHYPRAIDSVLMKSPLPSLPDDEGSIALVDSLGNVMDSFHYSDDYHSPFLKDDEGVSLERISLEVATNDPNNWRSASKSENYATPGYKNSSATNLSVNIEGEITVDPEIFSPGTPPKDFTRINYKFEQSGKVANVVIYDHQGRIINTLANNEVLGVEGFFRWDGERSDGGRARAGYYVAMVEVYDASGTVNSYRKRIVIAAE